MTTNEMMAKTRTHLATERVYDFLAAITEHDSLLTATVDPTTGANG